MPSPEIFRKIAIDRLASPEQLDQLMQVTSPKGWLALITVVAIVALAIVWGVVGSIQERVDGSGILLLADGVVDVPSPGSGRLTDISVRIGDSITEGQIIAHLELPELDDQIRHARSQVAELDTQYRQVIGLLRRDANLQSTSTGQLQRMSSRFQLETARRDLETLETERREQSAVSSPHAGLVLQVMSSPGALIARGSPLFVLATNPTRRLVAIIYIRSLRRHSIRPGMRIDITPATAAGQSSGPIPGRVTSVSDGPATSQQMLRVLRNPVLVQTLSAGAPYEVRAELMSDASTPDLLRGVDHGTLVTATIVTTQRRPILLVLPRLGSQPAESQ
jgi:multidrug efflux pump subunit AcrA (membrane-fusion protein)